MKNKDRFAEIYAVKLVEALARHPEEYLYPVGDVPHVVTKMIPSLAKGSANIGPAVKATARVLGIKPTIGAIRAYLENE